MRLTAKNRYGKTKYVRNRGNWETLKKVMKGGGLLECIDCLFTRYFAHIVNENLPDLPYLPDLPVPCIPVEQEDQEDQEDHLSFNEWIQQHGILVTETISNKRKRLRYHYLQDGRGIRLESMSQIEDHLHKLGIDIPENLVRK